MDLIVPTIGIGQLAFRPSGVCGKNSRNLSSAKGMATSMSRIRARLSGAARQPASCGDGVLQEGEDCDASNVGSATCESLGFDSGRVICSSTCRYDTALCVKRCGNGVLDFGEACDGQLGVTPCTTWGSNTCSAQCTIQTNRCVAQGFDPTVVGDLAPKGPGDLLMVVPGLRELKSFPGSWAKASSHRPVANCHFRETPQALNCSTPTSMVNSTSLPSIRTGASTSCSMSERSTSSSRSMRAA